MSFVFLVSSFIREKLWYTKLIGIVSEQQEDSLSLTLNYTKTYIDGR